MSRAFRSLYVNRAKHPHRKAADKQPVLFTPDTREASRQVHTPVIPNEPLPKRIYESNGLIFGLHDGGQESNPVPIQWKRLAPIRKVESE